MSELSGHGFQDDCLYNCHDSVRVFPVRVYYTILPHYYLRHTIYYYYHLYTHRTLIFRKSRIETIMASARHCRRRIWFIHAPKQPYLYDLPIFLDKPL